MLKGANKQLLLVPQHSQVLYSYLLTWGTSGSARKLEVVTRFKREINNRLLSQTLPPQPFLWYLRYSYDACNVGVRTRTTATGFINIRLIITPGPQLSDTSSSPTQPYMQCSTHALLSEARSGLRLHPKEKYVPGYVKPSVS